MAQDKVLVWMREQAPWYAEHSAWPVTDIAEEANNIFDREQWERSGRPYDWAMSMENKRCNQAERVFKQMNLPMHCDAEDA